MAHAPAVVFPHALQFQMPTHVRFMVSCACGAPISERPMPLRPRDGPESLAPPNGTAAQRTLPQNTQVYTECCPISIFLMDFLIEAPYRVPYLPVIPTFLVRLP